MAKYIVSLAVDGRVDVEVEADSFKDAFEKAKTAHYDTTGLEVVGVKPVNATDEHGTLEDY